MWDVLSGDFDLSVTPEKCAKKVIENAQAGSIVVFHDSEKSLTRMQKALTESLKYFSERGFVFEAIV